MSIGNKELAMIKMTAIPSTSEPSSEEQGVGEFLKMFDNPDYAFTGMLRLNLTTGEVDSYSEKFNSRWLIIDPAAKTQDTKEVDSITMGAIRLRSLIKIS